MKKGAVRDLDDGTQFVQEYIGSVEGSLLNAIPANVDDFITNFDNQHVDAILDDDVNKEITVYKDFIVHGEEDEVDGDKNVLLISGTKKNASKAAIRDRFSYSAFV